ncbi:MAG: SMI1/KNR4 family protein [Stenotrophomonas sp.]|jgi:cell wall assembly regulator SMI1|uniref:SMI1/KNR4 family protein n=1 Tax=Stenotrophomonas capsici TaxID=3110230 RepID=A0ABU5V0C4_9GAMM|nr:SMI1/KNR4 family protein [Stenotrophomonas sp. MH1]MEA5666736.1 SMI1/KNR4 family protein [Stenotrophomonas sp. MH1]
MDFPAYLTELAALYAANDQALQLAPGVSEDALADAERELGFTICPLLKSAWRHANGSEDAQTVFARPGYLTGYRFLSLQQAMQQWRGMHRRAPQYDGYEDPRPRDVRLQSGWAQQGWLPFAGFHAPILMLILDHSPSAHGRPGQIISFTHDPDAMDHVCDGFAALLPLSLTQIADAPEDLLLE